MTDMLTYGHSYESPALRSKLTVGLLLLFGNFIPLLLTGQYPTASHLERSRGLMNGSSLVLGSHDSRFLNDAFSRRVADKTIRPAFGSRIATEYHFFPFFVGAGYFESNFRIHDFAWELPDGENIKHYGLDLTAGVFLVHSTTRILPYLACSYQSGAIKVSQPYYKSGEKTNQLPVSTSATTGPLLRLGMQSRLFGSFRIQGEYFRSLGEARKAFYGYWFGVNILILKK